VEAKRVADNLAKGLDAAGNVIAGGIADAGNALASGAKSAWNEVTGCFSAKTPIKLLDGR